MKNLCLFDCVERQTKERKENHEKNKKQNRKLKQGKKEKPQTKNIKEKKEGNFLFFYFSTWFDSCFNNSTFSS